MLGWGGVRRSNSVVRMPAVMYSPRNETVYFLPAVTMIDCAWVGWGGGRFEF